GGRAARPEAEAGRQAGKPARKIPALEAGARQAACLSGIREDSAGLSIADRFLRRHRGSGAGDCPRPATAILRRDGLAHYRTGAGPERRRRPAPALQDAKHVLTSHTGGCASTSAMMASAALLSARGIRSQPILPCRTASMTAMASNC